MFLRKWLLHLRGYTFYTPLSQKHQQQTSSTRAAKNGNVNVASMDGTAPLIALALLGIILMYFYLCDRTNFFMKENKYYSEFSFWIPVSYVFALGLFFTEDSRFTKVLNRDQTNELKGWRMLVLLIYYMTGAHRVLPNHIHLKLLIRYVLDRLQSFHLHVANLELLLRAIFNLNLLVVKHLKSP